MSQHDLDTSFLAVIGLAVAGPYLLHRYTALKNFMPLVVIQIIFGIALGPTLLGNLWPEAGEFVANSGTQVKALGFLAVLFFGFTTGTHIDVDHLHGNGHMGSLMKVSLASLVIPALTALPVGYYLGTTFPSLLGAGGTPGTYSPAYAILVSVTALPVLSAQVIQMGLRGTPLGNIGLFCATVNDGLLWVLMAFYMALLTASTDGMGGFLQFVALSALYGSVMWFGVRRLLGKVKVETTRGALALSTLICITSAMATHLIGLHYLLGAVLAGMVIPRQMKDKIEEALGISNEFILLPFFFLSTGLVTNIPFQASAEFWTAALVTTALTIVTKVGATYYVATRTGLLKNPAEALQLGSLMSSKGLMEIVVLKILLEMTVISTVSFGAYIVMAVLATAYVMPAVKLIAKYRGHSSAPHLVAEEVA